MVHALGLLDETIEFLHLIDGCQCEAVLGYGAGNLFPENGNTVFCVLAEIVEDVNSSGGTGMNGSQTEK